MMKKKTLVLLILILVLALFLRVYRIGHESFWIDEGATALALEKYDGLQITENILRYGNILPEYYSSSGELIVYFFTINYWSELFLVSEVSLRLYSVVFGLLSIIFIFLISKLLFGEKNAIVSSILMAISIPAIVFSQEARHYTLYLFLGIASMYYLVRALRNNNTSIWTAYFIFTVLGLYTHFLFTVLLMFQGFYLMYHLITIKGYSIKSIVTSLLKKKSEIKKIFLVFLLLTLLLIPLTLRVFGENTSEPWWSEPTIEKAIRIFMNFSTWIYPTIDAKEKINRGLIFNLSAFDIILFLSVALTAILSYLLIAYSFYKKISKTTFKVFLGKEKEFILVAGWFGFPLIFSFVLSILTPVTIFGIFQYFFYSLAPFIMLVSQGMVELKPKLFKYTLIIFILLNIIPLYSYYSNVDKQQWRELAGYIEGKIGDDEVVIISSDSGEVTFRYYYGNNFHIYGVENLEETKKHIEGKKSLWLILSHWKYQDPEGAIQNYIAENYEILEKKRFFDIEVYHFKKK
jgi:mannosyltransferase